MKVAIINTTYNIGSTGKLTHSFRSFLLNVGVEVLTMFGRGVSAPNQGLVQISSPTYSLISNALERITGYNGCFSLVSTSNALAHLRRFQPDLVYLGNLHGHYINIFKLYSFLRESGIPIVKIMWDEYAMTGSCAFSYGCTKFMDTCTQCNCIRDYPTSWLFDTSKKLQEKKRKAYLNQRICFVGVPYTAERAKLSKLIRNHLVYAVDEAVDQNSTYYPRDTKSFKQELGIPDTKKIILNVCVYPNKRKGGQYYLELARKCKDPDIVFVHVGFMGKNEECPSNYIPIGYENDQTKMAYYYSLADLFVCTSLAETQPNTCIESLSCGTPICGFRVSGIPTCAVEPFGKYVDVYDIDALLDIVKKCKRKTPETTEAVRNYAVSRFSSDDYNRKLLQIGVDLLQNT